MMHMHVQMNLASLSTACIHDALQRRWSWVQLLLSYQERPRLRVLQGLPVPPLISEQSQPQLENTGTWRDNTLYLIGLCCSRRQLTGNVLKQPGTTERKQDIKDRGLQRQWHPLV